MSDIHKCQYCGRSYDYWDSNKAGTEYSGRFCSTKCNYEARSTGSFTPSSSSSSRSMSDGAAAGGFLLSLIPILLIIQFFRYISDHPNHPTYNQSQSSNQGYKASCGDNNPNGSSLSWYPVFVNKTDQNTLNYIRQNYCGDAFVKYRESANRKSIQVGSFLDYSKADSFAKAMIRDPKINSGEVGEATQN